MKARKKGSNDEWKDVIYAQLEGSDILYKEQYLEFQPDTLSTELKTYDQVDMEKYWQSIRNQAAIAAMQSIAQTIRQGIKAEVIAKEAVEIADALVKSLKEE